MKTKHGFTLIELLVVIAIIGILAAVVIGSLNDARSGGQNSSITQSVSNVRSQAEVFYNANNYTYDNGVDGVCTDSDIQGLMTAAIQVVGGPTATFTASDSEPSSPTVAACHDQADAYAASAPLIPAAEGGTQEYWCVDSLGTSKQTVDPLGANEVVCPAS